MNEILAWGMFVVILWVFLVGSWWFQRSYQQRMIRLAVEVVLEAQRLSKQFPNEYVAYRASAEQAFNEHAAAPLVKLLPEVVPENLEDA